MVGLSGTGDGGTGEGAGTGGGPGGSGGMVSMVEPCASAEAKRGSLWSSQPSKEPRHDPLPPLR